MGLGSRLSNIELSLVQDRAQKLFAIFILKEYYFNIVYLRDFAISLL